MCSSNSCKPNVAYAIVDSTKIYRITFSLSLAEYIAKITNKKVKRIKFKLGRYLEPGQESSTRFYAVCKSKNLWPLRVTFFKELAELWKSPTTEIYECELVA